eukprot:1213730-Amorphochlora_amoeboformis.AAC.1
MWTDSSTILVSSFVAMPTFRDSVDLALRSRQNTRTGGQSRICTPVFSFVSSLLMSLLVWRTLRYSRSPSYRFLHPRMLSRITRNAWSCVTAATFPLEVRFRRLWRPCRRSLSRLKTEPLVPATNLSKKTSASRW